MTLKSSNSRLWESELQVRDKVGYDKFVMDRQSREAAVKAAAADAERKRSADKAAADADADAERKRLADKAAAAY